MNPGYSLRTPNNNWTVEAVTFTAAEMRDMYEIREVIDGLAARQTAARKHINRTLSVDPLPKPSPEAQARK